MKSPLRILHLEDDQNDAGLIQETLAAEGIACDVVRVETRADFLDAIEQGGFDIILVDYLLPSFDGISALEIEREKCSDVPFIFVSGAIGEELAIETLKRGATDYVLKAKLSRLAPSVRRALREAEERSERKRVEEALRENFVQLAKKNRNETIISAVTQSVHQSINIQDVLENAVDAMSKNIDGAEHVSIFLAEGQEAVLKAYRGYPDWFIERIKRIPYPKGATWKTITDGKPIYCADVDKDTVIGPAEGEARTKSYVSMPIRFEGRTVGALVINSFERNAFDEEEIKLLEIVAQQIEIAINNAQKAEALRQSEAALARQTQELARSNAELEQFAYVASHDLQEPLRMVASYLQLIEQRYKGRLDSDADDFIAYAVDGAKRMQQLINGLLTYSRVGARGKSFEPTNCEAVFGIVLANLKMAIEDSGVAITHDALPTVIAEASQLSQLFQNLIGNAIKFRGEEPPHIHVSAGRNGNEWVFSVRDNGIGIDPQYAERIFIIFQRLHSGGKYAGTGIGLAICKKIVEYHGGRIWMESEVGKGATFYFTMPACDS